MAATAIIALPQQSTQTSLARICWMEVRCELLKLARNRAYLLSMTGFPVVFYLLFGVANRHEVYAGHSIARYLLAGYSCFGAMGSSLFGIGAGLAHERSHGWLELKRSSPMPGAAYLLGKLCVSIIFAAGIMLLLLLLGVALGGVVITPVEALRLLSVNAIGVLPFGCLGFIIGLLMPANAAPGVINLIYLPLSFCGGLWMPVETLPHWMQVLEHALPSYWFERLALGALGYSHSSAYLAWGVLAAYTVVFLLTATMIFRRQEAQA